MASKVFHAGNTMARPYEFDQTEENAEGVDMSSMIDDIVNSTSANRRQEFFIRREYENSTLWDEILDENWDEEDEDEDDLEEHKGSIFRGLVKFLVLLSVLVFSTLYISSMNSPESSPAVDSLRIGYNKVQNHVFELANKPKNMYDFLSQRGGIEIESVLFNQTLGRVKELEEDLIAKQTLGRVKELEEDLLTKQTLGRVKELEEDLLTKQTLGRVKELEKDLVSKQTFGRVKELEEDLVRQPMDDQTASLSFKTDGVIAMKPSEDSLKEDVVLETIDDEAPVLIYKTDEAIARKPIEDLLQENIIMEVVDDQTPFLSSETGEAIAMKSVEDSLEEDTFTETVEDQTPLLISTKNEAIALNPVEDDKQSYGNQGKWRLFVKKYKVIAGGSLMMCALITFFIRRFWLVPATKPRSGYAIKEFVPETKEDDHNEFSDCIVNYAEEHFISSTTSEEDSIHMRRSIVPSVELLGEFVVDNIGNNDLTRFKRKSQYVNDNDAESSYSISVEKALKRISLSSSSYDSSTPEKKISNKKLKKVEADKEATTTPVRRSSRIRKLGIVSP